VETIIRNRLDQETSPYLLQHRENPVFWQPWDNEALTLAQHQDRPILLSIGYSACHWCHVMAHESFEDEATAALMNDLFVNIKVDREERPDLDNIYQMALAFLGRPGGWPLTMFLTPEGEPFWGGTYFPPTPRYGQPGFQDVLRAVHDAYRRAPDKLEQNRSALVAALNTASRTPPGEEIPSARTDEVAQRLLDAIDPVNGGIGTAPKFPQVTALSLLWRSYFRSGKADFKNAVLLTAQQMCQGGIYDHIGGGFARYATDSRWLVPHFEKMLYDNALLLDLLAQLWQETGAALFRIRVEETVDWALREMVAPDGGFASTIDADSEGEEGKFYTWSAEEIHRLLGRDAPYFCAIYDVTPEGNWERRTILNRLKTPPDGEIADESRLSAMREILFRARTKRVPPSRDDKVLADWNGLMISALASVGAVFDRPEWIAAAEKAFSFICARMGTDGRLGHSYRSGRVMSTAVLDDYANMVRAAINLFEVTGKSPYVSHAEAWVDVANSHYWDENTGGYFFTANDAEHLIVRAKTAQDGPVPSGNGTMVEDLARLYVLTANSHYRDRAEAVIRAFAGAPARELIASCALLNGNEMLGAPLQVVLVGDWEAEATRRMRRAVFETSGASRVFSQIEPTTDLPQGHPAAGKSQVDGRPTAYVCRGATCSLPINEVEELKIALLQSEATAKTAIAPSSPGLA
jgi:uncharacterized protein